MTSSQRCGIASVEEHHPKNRLIESLKITAPVTAFTTHLPCCRHVYSKQLLLNPWRLLSIEPRSGQASLISRRRPLATS